VRKALTAGLEIDSYAGVSAPLMALELSGLAPIPFTFHGFLPRDKGPRTKYLQNLAKGTHIFFEGVSRVADTLKILGAVHPNAPMAVARELSKTFQTMHYFMGSNVSEMLPDVTLKGEFVLLVEVQEEVQDFELQELAKEVLSKGGQSKSLSKLLAKILKTHSKEVYQELNRQK
jgi:16S rRNA (cytidine1402-2'-O)-methyltransferase